MQLSAEAHIPFPREVVFATLRDEMDRLLPYLPSIRSIEITSRKAKGEVVENVLEWQGGGNIPAPLRAVLGGSVLSWTDYAVWDAATMICDWRTETRLLPDALHCGARDRFLEDGPGKTLLELRGAIDVDGQKIPGVPVFLAAKVARFMETFLVGKIQADLVKTAEGLARYLRESRSRSRDAASDHQELV